MGQNVEPCVLLDPACGCVALKQKHPDCFTANCPFYVTAERRERSETAARERCKKLGIPYGDDYAKAVKGEL